MKGHQIKKNYESFNNNVQVNNHFIKKKNEIAPCNNTTNLQTAIVQIKGK